MKKLLLLAAIAAITLSAVQANTITITPNSNTNQKITTQGSINAVAIVGGKAIDPKEGGTKFKGLDIDFGTSDPADIVKEWQTKVPLFVKTNTTSAVTMSLMGSKYMGNKIPLEYKFDGVVIKLDGSESVTVNEGATNDGQTPINHTFEVGVESSYSDFNTPAGDYHGSVTATITIS